MPKPKKADSARSTKTKSTKTTSKPKLKAPTKAKTKTAPVVKPKAAKKISVISAPTPVAEKKSNTVKSSPKIVRISNLSPVKSYDLPRHGQTQMVTFIRDPKCLFTYWEIDPETEEGARKELGSVQSHRVLRAFKMGPGGEEILLVEIPIQPDEMNRYVQLEETGGSYFLEVGWKTAAGRYIPLVRSNRVTTATGDFSQQVEPSWEPPSALMEYFSEEEEGFSAPAAKGPGGPSSASWFKLKSRHSASKL